LHEVREYLNPCRHRRLPSKSEKLTGSEAVRAAPATASLPLEFTVPTNSVLQVA
jgi:hypothetical protein